MTPLLLGIDPSKNRLGWALLELETGRPLVAGTADINVAGGGWLHEQVAEAFRAMPCVTANREVGVVVREEPTTSFVRVAKDHGAVCALVDAECRRRWPHAPLWTLMPKEWRKLAGLPGNASKDDVRWEASRLSVAAGGPIMVDQDAADALVIATAGWRQWYENPRTEAA